MDISRNILYQRNNFKEIYKGYFNEASMEVAASIESSYEVNKNNFIAIVVEEYSEVLKEIFHLNLYERTFLQIEDCDEIILKKHYDDEVEVNSWGEKCSIKAIIPYRLRGNYIKLIKKVKSNKLKGASLIIVNRTLSLFDKRILQENNKVILCNELDSIKNELIEFKPYYDEKGYVEKVLKLPEKRIIDINFQEDSFKVNVAIDFINYLSSDEANGRDEFALAKEINDRAIATYEKRANEVVERYLTSNFQKNFHIVNLVIKSIDTLNSKLYKMIIKKFIRELKIILKEEKKSSRYLLLMKSDLMKIDKLMSDELNCLNKELNYIILEEKC